MDRISFLLCEVADSAELCRGIHPDPAMNEGATNATMIIQNFMNFLNTNVQLYQIAKKALETSVISLFLFLIIEAKNQTCPLRRWKSLQVLSRNLSTMVFTWNKA